MTRRLIWRLVGNWKKIYRQTDTDFIGLLNAIRNRSADDDDLTRLNRNCNPTFVPPENEF